MTRTASQPRQAASKRPPPATWGERGYPAVPHRHVELTSAAARRRGRRRPLWIGAKQGGHRRPTRAGARRSGGHWRVLDSPRYEPEVTNEQKAWALTSAR